MIDQSMTLWTLLEDRTINIPAIQRDYVQGRNTKQIRNVREQLLQEMVTACSTGIPMSLNFVYGENRNSHVEPLDGQQRLTTLFLLYWYAAVVAPDTEDEEGTQILSRLRKFSYATRTTSADFFARITDQEYVGHLFDHLTAGPSSAGFPSQVLTNKGWFRAEWLLDPTIASCLIMLDLMHTEFSQINRLAKTLIGEECPLRFDWIDVENIGNGDVLYIKMNARGKPLSELDNLKADLEANFPSTDESFKTQFFTDIDQTWTDFFWNLGAEDDGPSYGTRFMNVLHSLLFNRWVLLNGKTLRSERSWPEHVRDLEIQAANRLLSDYCSVSGEPNEGTKWPALAWLRKLSSFLNYLAEDDNSTNDEHQEAQSAVGDLVRKVATTAPKDLRRADRFMLQAAFEFFGRDSEHRNISAWPYWHKTLWNLSEHAQRYRGYSRVSEYYGTLRALTDLSEHADDLVTILSDAPMPLAGFQQEPVIEEQLKARLRINSPEWGERIDRAEQALPYFNGRIEFLLSVSGAVEGDDRVAAGAFSGETAESFESYVAIMSSLFGKDGVRVDSGLFRAALLSKGDFSLPIKALRTYIVDSDPDRDWRLALRPRTPSQNARLALEKLLGDLRGRNCAIEDSLRTVIRDHQWAPTRRDIWARDLVEHPELFDALRKENSRLQFAERGTEVLVPAGNNTLGGYNNELFILFLTDAVQKEGVIVHPLRARGSNRYFVSAHVGEQRELTVIHSKRLEVGHLDVYESPDDPHSLQDLHQEVPLFSGEWKSVAAWIVDHQIDR